MTATSSEAKAGKQRRRSPADAAGAVDGQGGKVVGAVAAAIKIMRYLGESRDPVGVSRIAKDTRLNTSTTFNILRTLALNDIVTFDPSSKAYALSLGLLEIARGATAIAGDISAALPLMERIAQKHGVTITLWQPVSRNRKVLILSAVTRSAMRIQMAVGQRLPIYIGATGRVFAAFGETTDEELKTRFNEIRWDRPLEFADFMTQVRETREQGWALDDGNFAVGTVSLAAPIFNRNRTANLAVTATMFAGQYDPARVADVVKDLGAFGEQVSQLVSS